jgi:hypothetical protein
MNKRIFIVPFMAYLIAVTTRKVLLKLTTLRYSAEECHVRSLYCNSVYPLEDCWSVGDVTTWIKISSTQAIRVKFVETHFRT